MPSGLDTTRLGVGLIRIQSNHIAVCSSQTAKLYTLSGCKEVCNKTPNADRIVRVPGETWRLFLVSAGVNGGGRLPELKFNES